MASIALTSALPITVRTRRVRYLLDRMDAGCGSGQLGMTVRFVDTNVEAVELHGDILRIVRQLDLLVTSDLDAELLETVRRERDYITVADDLVRALAALSVIKSGDTMCPYNSLRKVYNNKFSF